MHIINLFQVGLYESYLMGLSPAVFYIAVCMSVSGNTAILVAAALSVVYAEVMMLVIVGTLMNAVQVK